MVDVKRAAGVCSLQKGIIGTSRSQVHRLTNKLAITRAALSGILLPIARAVSYRDTNISE